MPDGHKTAFTAYSTGASSYDVLIGATRNTPTAIILPMHGAIDEVHIFDKTLSDSEIRLLAAGASTEDIDEVLKPVDRSYRYAYQGQFAELDKETGWSHFELREYDAVIGRWHARDPFGQYWSPYVGMGNNPVSRTDPNGGYSRAGAWWRSGFGLRGEIYQSGMDNGREIWGFNTSSGAHFGDDARSGIRELLTLPENSVPAIGSSGVAFRARSSSLSNLARFPAADQDPINNGTFAFDAGSGAFDNFDNFTYNHETYLTTKGIVKPIFLLSGAARSQRARIFATRSAVVKGVGNTLGVIGTGIAYYNIGTGNGTYLDAADAAMGTAGAITAGLEYLGLATAPAALGQVGALYGWGRLWYDIGTYWGPSKWYGTDNHKWFR
ncbi:RHS repeat-associated core domain-containing protein [Fulvivirgaceae bacterium PWU37]|uniref:RHS repeat-associated core domain-containing protein n=1 Tax=Dawidia soli TaxID=2782352 RepID=A0AAP2DBJ9_9BACT|nr:RHS repeat-associated core domain-containing protein [Dawidia soli]